MTDNDDYIFYGAYGGVFISLGLWVFIMALGFITSVDAALLWILTIGIIAMLVANIPKKVGRRTPQKNVFGLGFGFILIIIALTMLAVVNDILNTEAAIGLIILFVGIGIFVFGMATKQRYRRLKNSEKNDYSVRRRSISLKK